ncbi:MAG: hypothetical protein ACD_77C00144G0001 [uncultured bacterium]|nr:MAG: hypothetical protein ACD_77C00144G0001 [uncultured bacterium]HBY01405.1 hypothetical protein [Rikenellaceae bacterium]
MKNSLTLKWTLAIVALFAIVAGTTSCEKIELEGSYSPSIYFETGQSTINTQTGTFDINVKLSKPAPKNLTVKFAFSGTAIENEHYTLVSKEIVVEAGKSEAVIPVTLLNDNIWDSELTLKATIVPGTDYAVDPKINPEHTVLLTKEIVLPMLSFTTQPENEHTNPFLAEKLIFTVAFDTPLAYDSEAALNIEGDLTIGADFLINGGNTNKITLTKGQLSQTFEVQIKQRDAAGISKNLKFTLDRGTSKYFAVSTEKGSFNVRVNDPEVDFTPVMKSAALLSGSGFQILQAIKASDGTWSGKVVINAGPNSSAKNYMRSYKNMSFNTYFGCQSNSPGGDILRLSDMLLFATTDTVMADYGVGKTTRFFSPSDSLLRFVAQDDNPLKGTVTANPQEFSANIILKADWETGTNGNKQWHLDSKTTNGIIANCTYPVLATMIVELVKLEGTYDFSSTEPEIIFDAWFKSTSPYFMRIQPALLDIKKEGDLYKVSYRYTPK